MNEEIYRMGLCEAERQLKYCEEMLEKVQREIDSLTKARNEIWLLEVDRLKRLLKDAKQSTLP